MTHDAVETRRGFLCQLVGALGLLYAGRVGGAATRRIAPEADTVAAEQAAGFAAALEREIGQTPIETTDRITFTIPAVAEDGAVVPVSLESNIAGTDRLVLFAEKNPFPLLAAFDFPPTTLPFVTLRVKLNATGEVVALARAHGRYYLTKRAVRVVVGGCG